MFLTAYPISTSIIEIQDQLNHDWLSQVFDHTCAYCLKLQFI